MVFDAACQGDSEAVALFEKLGRWLGIGIASLVLTFDPNIVLIGGGLAHTEDLLLRTAREAATRNLPVRNGRLPPVVRAQFDAEAGVVGAGILALDEIPT